MLYGSGFYSGSFEFFMALNVLWFGMMMAGFVWGLVRWTVWHDPSAMDAMSDALFKNARLSFDILIGMVGVMSFWMGILKIAQESGCITVLSRWIAPLMTRLMPEIPRDHPAFGHIALSIAANILGLDNAATPMGLQAMRSLHTLNPEPDRASFAQIMFVVITASSVTLLPTSILMYRSQLGAANPTDIFLPIIIATTCSTLAGVVMTGWVQGLRLRDPILLSWLAGTIGLLSLLWFGLAKAVMPASSMATLANALLLGVIALFLSVGWRRKVPLYDSFIDGAREGFGTTLKIAPFLLAMLVALGTLRASGLIDSVLHGIQRLCEQWGYDAHFLPALPTALMKPISGSGARAAMIEAMQMHGPDSFVGRLVCIIQGSADTTFYIVAVYFGTVGIRQLRHTLPCSLIAEAVGIVAAIGTAYWFFAP